MNIEYHTFISKIKPKSKVRLREEVEEAVGKERNRKVEFLQ